MTAQFVPPMSIFAPGFNPIEPTTTLSVGESSTCIEQAIKGFTREILESFQTDIDFQFDDSIHVGAKRERQSLDLEETQVRNYLKSAWDKIQWIKTKEKVAGNKPRKRDKKQVQKQIVKQKEPMMEMPIRIQNEEPMMQDLNPSKNIEPIMADTGFNHTGSSSPYGVKVQAPQREYSDPMNSFLAGQLEPDHMIMDPNHDELQY